MADSNTQKLYVEGATDEAALKAALGEGATVRVFKTGAIIEIVAEKAGVFLKAGTIAVAGKDHPVTPPRERPVKPQAETPKAGKPAVPPIPKGPVAVKPGPRPAVAPPKGMTMTVARPAPRPVEDHSAELAELRGKNKALRRRLDELEAAARKNAWLTDERVRYFLAQNAVSLLLGREVGEDGTILVLEADIGAFVGTPEKASHTLMLIRYYLDAHGMKEARIGFEGNLETNRHDDREDAKKAADPARTTLADAQRAKAKERGHKRHKAKGARNASPTTEAPAPVPPPQAEIAAAQQ